ncbi:hypothetical protein B0H10DRAFT_1967821 [Mycena sp. CBHHK59/15]|nr:hypothetical protein B0H10DRAFT_1967821 [Mycena sp. CBHHK59/15]
MTSTAPTRPVWNHQVSSCIANDDNSVGLSAVAQNLLSAKPIIDLVKKIAKITLFLPETVPLATEEDDIPRRIFELEEHVRDSDGRLKYVRRGNLGMDCVVKYLKSIHWESTKIPLDLAQGKLARIADELDYLCGGDQEPMKPAGKIADPRPSFTKDARYEKKMDVFFAASTTTTTQKKSKLKSTNETDDSEDDFDDVIEIDRLDPPAVKDTFSQLARLKLIAAPPPAKRKSEEELEGPAKASTVPTYMSDKKPGTLPDEFMNRLSEQRKDDKK